MARGVNKVIIVGNLGQDPETRTFPDGGTVTNISVATSDAWKDRQTGQQQERTEWHRVVLRDRGNYRLGQIAAQYLQKGSKVFIEGSLRTRKYQDNNGQDRFITEIIANELQMLDSRGEGMGSSSGQGNQFQQPQQQSPAQQNTNQAPAQTAPSDFGDFDDDIPF